MPVAFAIVALGSATLSLPTVLASWRISPDAIGYVGTAHNWVAGRGFLDPIVYTNYLPELRPPAPATAIRPPVFSVLLALPLALGADLEQLATLHVIWASLIGASVMFAARRLMKAPLAIAFAVAVSWSAAWSDVSTQIITEATAIAILVLAIATCRSVVRCEWRAALFALLTLVGWLTRPNLGVVAPAALITAIFELGPRRALKCRPLWVYALVFGALQQLASFGISAWMEVPLYGHYGVMAELRDFSDLAAYRKEYLGLIAYIQAHGWAMCRALASNLSRYLEALFLCTTYLHAGWIGVPGLAHAALRRGDGCFERRFTALAGCALGLTAVAAFGSFDPGRYPLPSVVCFLFLGFGLLDDGVMWLRRHLVARGASRRLAAASAWAPLIIVFGVWSIGNLGTWASDAERKIAVWKAHGTVRAGTTRPGEPWHPVARRLCGDLDPDAVVASHDPWTLYLWCGNAGYLLPRDLETQPWLRRWLEEKKPAFVVANRDDKFAFFLDSPQLTRIREIRGHTLFAVRESAPESRPWRAPPALSALGRSQR